jgi:hypothetical protein|tara:strand:- start:10278 stop:10526 length:249 start_codon:yes stop_codon:yes gene_type:complete
MSKEKNTRKSNFELLLDDVKGKHSKKVNAILLTQGEGDEEAFMVNYFKILEYVSPKLQRREIIEEERDSTITIEHTFRKQKE